MEDALLAGNSRMTLLATTATDISSGFLFLVRQRLGILLLLRLESRNNYNFCCSIVMFSTFR